VRRPVLLFPERLGLAHSLARGLAPYPFPSRLALPPQVKEKEGCIVERRPLPPPLKGQDSLPPWRMEGGSRS